jgi:MoxR-like ATPase
MNESYHNTDLHEKIMGAVSAIETVIVGKHNEIVLLMTALLAGAHVLIEDVPGTGKTSLAAALSRVTGLDFNRAQFTPDVMASDITGFNIYNRQKESFEFREGLVMCNLLLADEINRASPKTQSALLEAMEENRVTVDGVTYDVPDPFMVIATQNPTGYVGTYPLPEAQLDRFAFKLSMGYPSQNEEVGILRARRGENPMDKLTSVVTAEELRAARAAVTQVRVDESLYTYIVSLVAATRQHKALSLGASPRASVALMHLAQAYAYLRGRDYVIPDDVKELAVPVLAHRIILRGMYEQNTASFITGLLRQLPVPTEEKA